jgi:PAS domain S-box-containing protein
MDADMTDRQIKGEIAELRRRVAELEGAEEPRYPDKEPGESETYFRLLVENAYDVILVLNRDGSLRYISPSARHITGFSSEELLGRNPFELVYPDDLPAIMEKFTSGIEDPGRTEHVEFRVMHRDGMVFMVEAVAKNLLEEPAVHGIVVNLRDITQFRKVEHDLRKSEERYRHLVENLNDVVFTVNAEGTIIYLSPAIERVTKYKVEDMLNQPLMRFIHPEDLPGLLESFQRTLNGILEPYEFRIIDKDGGLLHVQTSSRPFEEDGQPAGLIGLLSEITERKQADEARRRSEESFRAMIRKNIHYYRGS